MALEAADDVGKHSFPDGHLVWIVVSGALKHTHACHQHHFHHNTYWFLKGGGGGGGGWDWSEGGGLLSQHQRYFQWCRVPCLSYTQPRPRSIRHHGPAARGLQEKTSDGWTDWRVSLQHGTADHMLQTCPMYAAARDNTWPSPTS